MALAAWVGHVTASDDSQRVSAATVRITTIASNPDYSKPWQSKGTETSTGSGAIIAGQRILTNAHVVACAASIEVKRPGLQKSFLARVEHIDHGSDLALLSVEDRSFFEGVTPLDLGTLPALESEVTAHGYPIGGETVSASSGVVSRLEHDTYAHGQRDLLLAQIDAALNPGNSGGPVVSGGKIVGVAMQTLEDSENIGYVIPAPVIERFLNDAADGTVAGTPNLGAYCLPIENEALREYLGLQPEQGGSIVVDVAYGSSAWGKLQQDDVLLAIDGVAIAGDCSVPLARGSRIAFQYLVEKKQVGGVAELTIWRDKAKQAVSVMLSRTDPQVPLPGYPARIPYRVIGGLVFQPADWSYLESLGTNIPSNLYHLASSVALPTEQRRELILLTSVLPHRVNRGYQEWALDVVETVQGVPVKDFEHFNSLLDGASGKWLNVTMDDKSRLVMALAAVRSANQEILDTFSIPQDRWPSTTRVNVASQ